EVETGKELRRLDGDGWVEGVVFTPDGRRALSNSGPLLKLWDVETGTEVRRFDGHRLGINSVALTPDGLTAATGAYDGSVLVWEVDSGRERARFTGHRKWVWSVAFAPDGKRLLSGGGGTGSGNNFLAGEDFTIRLWRVPAPDKAAGK